MNKVIFSREGRQDVVISLDKLDAYALRLCRGDVEQAREVVRRVQADEKVEVGAISVVKNLRCGVHYHHDQVQVGFSTLQESHP